MWDSSLGHDVQLHHLCGQEGPAALDGRDVGPRAVDAAPAHLEFRNVQNCISRKASIQAGTHGRRLFSRGGGKNASKIVVPPKMTLGEEILFALLGEG